MDSNALPSGMYPNSNNNVQPGNMLGLEMSLHHQIPPTTQPQNPQQQQHHHSTMLSGYPHYEADHYHHQTQQTTHQQQQASKPKTKSLLNFSDDDEPHGGGGYTAENNSADDHEKMPKTSSSSPWQRMKWTDNMVRLLIMVVYYIGDEVVSDHQPQPSNEPLSAGNKKKGVSSGAGGVLQKKGKWKSVSRAMMERGFYVSPQQCEDKFNDLNKRYKRVNDILGKGTACRVVENQSLLDTMDHLSSKTKEEVKKLLNSKHLFFREMCAYHNSCGHNTTGGGGAGSNVHHNSPHQDAVMVEPSPAAAAQTQQQRSCLHSKENGRTLPNLNRAENEGFKSTKSMSDDDDDDEDDDDDSDEDVNHDEDEDELRSRVVDHHHSGHVELTDERSSKKIRTRDGAALIQQLDAELSTIMHDSTRSSFEKRQWMRTKLIGLEEQRVGIQSQAYNIEKQRLKWFKFSSKKERDLEREKLTNERLKLENERMVLLLRQRELDFMDHHHQQQNQQQQHSSNKRSDITG